MPVSIANIQGYALLPPLQPVTLRTIGGYAMGVLPLSLALRRVSGYAMVDAALLPLNINGHDAVLNLISKHSLGQRPTSHFTIGAPSVYADPEGKFNSKVTATATAASLLAGSMEFVYKRVLMLRIAGNLSNITFSGISSVHQLIPAINTATGMLLTTADLVDDPISPLASEIVITAASTSYFFIPGSQVTVGKTTSLTTLFKSDSILWV